MKRNKKGQLLTEYTVLLIIVIAALLVMQSYIKRGVQGRWKSLGDAIGDQYDPHTTTSNIRHTLMSNTVTDISAVPDSMGGYWTSRYDATTSREEKGGYTSVGQY